MHYFSTKKGRLWTIVLVTILSIGMGLLSLGVKTNYDMSTYLPKDSNTKQGLEILETSFGNHAAIDLMVEDLSVNEILALKQDILAMNHVLTVFWLDDYVDLTTTPIDFIPESVKAPFIQGNKALLKVEFDLSSYDTKLDPVIVEIKTLTTHHMLMRGEVLNNLESHRVASEQLWVIMAIIVPLCVVILVIASKSYMEALLVLVTLGVAILFNMGTNILLGQISFITMTMAMALQLAMSLDYALFMLHRYHEYADLPPVERVKMALKKSFVSITVSSLTTVFGFLALCFMSYGFGLDMGLVLAKGIVFSYLSTLIVLPVLLVVCHKLILKTSHRVWLPSFKGLGQFLYQIRTYLLVGFVLLTVGVFFTQRQANYLYQNTGDAAELKADAARIETTFGSSNPVVILFKTATVADEVSLVQALSTSESIVSIAALVNTVDPNIPRELLPDSIKANFIQNGVNRIIVYTNIQTENEAFYDLNDFIITTTNAYIEDAYFIGVMPSTAEIKSFIQADTLLVLLLSIGLVALIIGLAFKSILMPILLVLVIESAIWFNIAINVVSQTEILYVGYLIILSIQLGATIDYAVLMASRYQEERLKLDRKQAFIFALEKSLPSIMISAIILAFAGFTEALVSDMQAIQDIGVMLGRGTLISLLFSIGFVLPMLDLIDRMKTKKT